jgi:NADH dehydrogenase [ubiquinone] 1 alpha subcomplex assembly factor 5
MINLADAGNLLTTSGFALPTVDTDSFTVEYPSAASLMEHLNRMGESNASLLMRHGGKIDSLLAAAATYQAMYGLPDGAVPATYEIIYLIGWSPAATQPKPLPRGSVPKGLSPAPA